VLAAQKDFGTPEGKLFRYYQTLEDTKDNGNQRLREFFQEKTGSFFLNPKTTKSTSPIQCLTMSAISSDRRAALYCGVRLTPRNL